MYKIFKHLLQISIFFLIMGCDLTIAQDTTRYGIRMIARPSIDSIMLRWAPVNYESWQKGNISGYVVERYTLFRNGASVSGKRNQILTSQPLKPIDLDSWEKLAENDDNAGIAAQAIYGKDFEPAAQGSAVMNIFNRASVQQNRYSFALFAADQSSKVARAMGLWFTDKKVLKGENYLYVVYFGAPDSIPTDTAYVYTGVDEGVPLQKPVFAEVDGSSNSIALSWRGPGGRNAYTSFELQRSNDGGTTFQALNKSPLVNTYPNAKDNETNFYIDTIQQNYKKYIYRVRGNSPFGEKGPFSDTISAMGKEMLKEVLHITRHLTLKDGVELTWDYSSKSEKLIKEFKVLRSTESNKAFLPISGQLTVHTRKFLDNKPLGTAYYVIQANGKNGEAIISFPVLVQLIDSIPPSAPVKLTAKTDTSGKVLLIWKANQEEDMYGYRIYRANASNEEFSQITASPVRDTFFVDRIILKTLTKKVYYKLMAIDQRQNHSELSEAFEIKRPDIVPPASPVLQSINSSSKGICVEWIPSNSSDVVSQQVLRKLPEEKAWAKISNLTNLDSSFCDTTITKGLLYQYTIQAVDDANLHSPITQLLSAKGQKADLGLMLIAKADRSNSGIILSWKGFNGNGKITIYRAEEASPLLTYATVDSKTSPFLDKKVKPATSYSYMIKFVGDDSLTVSEVITVKY